MPASLDDLSSLLENVPAGNWAAIARNRAVLVAQAADPDEVLRLSREQNEADPIVIRVPAGGPSLLRDEPFLREGRNAAGDETPCEPISWALAAGGAVPFLGAGASLSARTRREEWEPGKPFLPNAVELAEYLAGLAKFPARLPQDLDLAKVSSYYEVKLGRSSLREALRRAFCPLALDGSRAVIPGGTIHRYLARRQGPKLIVTTNYDTLIEDAFRAEKREYDLLVYPTDNPDHRSAAFWHEYGKEPQYQAANNLKISFERPVIYKMHGSVAEQMKHDTFVISEEDYLEFLSRMISETAVPAAVITHLQMRSLLFLGYSLRDWNLRLVLRNLKGVFGTAKSPRLDSNDEPIPSWAIQRKPNRVEEILWSKRQVDIYNQDVEEFACQLDGL
jgi:hypothetical protein